MSSLEIAKLTGKRHDNVTRDIRKMLKELNLEATHFSGALKTSSGQNATVFNLPKDLTLVTGYSIPLRYRIRRTSLMCHLASPEHRHNTTTPRTLKSNGRVAGRKTRLKTA